MSTDKHQSAIGAAASAGVAVEAALFATFYVDRRQASPIYERLRSLAQQTPEAFGAQNPTDEPLLTKSDPPAAHDATAILLILNAPGDAATAWETMRQRLREILYAPGLPAVWWGYTIVYQAVLNGDVDADSAFSELLPEVRRPDSTESLRQPLASANMSGGRVWMVDVPLRGDGPAAATVSVALSPPDKERAFKNALFDPALLMADLIAHKGYSIMRDYRGDREQDYKNKLKGFWKLSDELLGDLGGQIQKPGKLDEVAHWYGILASAVSKFGRMHTSLSQQLHNYSRWRAQTGGNGIVEYHYGHLETAKRELELLVAEGQDALEVADKALSMARVELDKAQTRNQRVISLLLAVVSAGLAAPNLAGHFWGDNLLVKFTAIVVVTVLILALVRLVGRWRT